MLDKIKQLRERTNLGLNACKKALEESEGDLEKAVLLLQNQNPKHLMNDAIPTEGMVYAAIKGSEAAIFEVNCQTDFAARSEIFINFVKDLADHWFGVYESPTELPWYKTNLPFISNMLKEKIVLKRWQRISSGGTMYAYNHFSGNVSAAVSLIDVERSSGFNIVKSREDIEAVYNNQKTKDFMEHAALHIVAAKPSVIIRNNLDAAILKKIEDDTTEELKGSKKPEKIWPNIIAGKVNKYCKEHVLVDQESVITAGKTIGELLAELNKELDSHLVIASFVRFERGQIV